MRLAPTAFTVGICQQLFKHKGFSLTMGRLWTSTRDWVACSQRLSSALRRSFMTRRSARLKLSSSFAAHS